jgi:hypothetical protein
MRKDDKKKTHEKAKTGKLKLDKKTVKDLDHKDPSAIKGGIDPTAPIICQHKTH